MNQIKFAMLATLLALAGCAGFNAAMTPSAEIIKDDFDGATIIRQSPVGSSSSLTESWHTLGFEWSTGKPDTIYITAGLVMQTENIQEVQFKADGELIENIELASNKTEFENNASSRRFSLPLSEFRKIAAANVVKMKIIYNLGNNSSVSSFGQDYPNVLTTSKIPPFMSKVDELRAAVEKKHSTAN